MIGMGTPSSHNKSPRPMTFSYEVGQITGEG